MAVRKRLLLVWSWRELRHRWVLICAIALIIAVGTGVYAGLGGTTRWRLRSNDASYAALGFHDLRASLPEGAVAPAGELAALARTVPDAASIAALEERLAVPVQLDASLAGSVVLVPGELVGAAPTAAIDILHLTAGSPPSDTVTPANPTTAVLESKFAKAHHLPSQGTVRISGGREVGYAGLGYSPEYFRVVGRPGSLTTEAGFGVVFTTLSNAQALTDHPTSVNQLVLRLSPGADAALLAGQLRVALGRVGAAVETRDDDIVYHGLYTDARNDERTWDFFALLILSGAAFAAFNLISRLVEAERRQIGVGMALGARPRLLAVRPLLVGAEAAMLGAVAGVGVGLVAGVGMRTALDAALPLPIWRTPFPTGRYVQGALLGLAVPLAATLVPVVRALRTEPVDLLRSMPGAGRPGSRFGAGLAPVLRRLPGRVTTLLPVRNVLRASRRTLLTALGITAAVTTLVAVLGVVDSMFGSIDRIDAALTTTAADRVQVTLDRFYPTSLVGQQVTSADAATISGAEPGLRVAGRLETSKAEIDAFVELIDLSHAMWAPSVTQGAPASGGGTIVIARKAAHDLGVSVGGTVVLVHPRRDGTSFTIVDTPMVVSGLHDNPLRFLAYLDAGDAGVFGLDGLSNLVTVLPAPGRSQDDVRLALFSRPGVASIETVGGIGPMYRERLGAITGILRILQVAALALALLIAFNSASISMEERVREQATMFAFGLPVRSVLRVLVVESAITGVLGTAIGMGTGYLAVAWLIRMFTTSTVPDLAMKTLVSGGTIATVAVLGVGVVAAAPVLALRRLTHLDIPSRLRILE